MSHVVVVVSVVGWKGKISIIIVVVSSGNILLGTIHCGTGGTMGI